MPIHPISLFPSPVLRKSCAKIERFDANLGALIKDLDETMRSQPHGIGIAAPQIGIPKQAAIVDVSARVPGSRRLVLINPAILEYSEEKASREGCMSLPDYTGNLKRYNRIKLEWQDESGALRIGAFSGIEAICIQHEVDHLNGLLFIDRVVSLKRDMLPRGKSSKA